MKFYTIIAGPYGAGKTSFLGILKSVRADLGKIIDADRGVWMSYPRVERAVLRNQAAETAFEKELDCIRKGISFTRETTLSDLDTMQVIKDARLQGYTVRMYYVCIDTADDAIGRIQNRVAKGGLGIPEEEVRQSYEDRFTNLATVIAYCDLAAFFDNENGFVEIGEYKNGMLITKSDNPPKWFVELKAYLRDPFNSEANMARLRKGIADLNAGKGTVHELIEAEDD